MNLRNYIIASLFLIGIFACQKKTIQLDITSNQDSSIAFVNNEKVGEAPIVTSTYPGIITIKVKKEGYEDFSIIDTLHNDTLVKIHALLFTKKELKEQLYISDKAGEFTDHRDNQKYKWVKLGKQIWMAENLAYEVESTPANCWVYNNNPANVESYGYLYNWEIAKEICPEGWHLPTLQEWQQLSSYLGGDRSASEKMRERGYMHWIDGYYYRPIATNESGFTARPGGQVNANGEFYTIGTYAYWWSSTPKNESESICFWLGYMGDYLNTDVSNKEFGLSVRCIKD